MFEKIGIKDMYMKEIHIHGCQEWKSVTVWADVKNPMPLCEKKMPLSDAIMFEKKLKK